MNRGVKNQTTSKAAWGARLRLGYFLVTIATFGFVLGYLIVLPLAAVGRVWPRAQKAADAMMCRGIAWMMGAQFWLRSSIEIEPVPGNPGLLLVSNHRSHLDVFILLSRIPGIRILAKSSLFQIPFLGVMMRASRQIPVARGSLADFAVTMEEIRRRLRKGEIVHVFPEMTRCPQGHQGVLPFSIAPFHAALQEGAVIQPLVIQGTDDYWPRQVHGLLRGRWARVRSLPALRAREFGSAALLRDEIQKRIEGALA